MKVHLLNVGLKRKKYREYICYIELGGERCQNCYFDGRQNSRIQLVESKTKPPKNIRSKCKSCKTGLVSFLDLPNEQKIAVSENQKNEHELNYLIHDLIYCPKCRTAYINYKSR